MPLTEFLLLTICTSVFTLIAFKNLTDLIINNIREK